VDCRLGWKNQNLVPYLSVITPSYNQGRFLRTCLESVASQGDPDYEHIICDNASTDETLQVVKNFPNVTFSSEKDRGQSHAVNKALTLAQGEIICWLNADDAYMPGLFAKLRAAFADRDTQVVYGDVRQVSYDGSGEGLARASFSDRLDLVRWWSGRVKLHQPAIFFRRSAAHTVGHLREDLHYAMDYEYWWRLSERHAFHYLPEPLAIQHRQPDSKTVAAWNKVYEEREKIFSPFYQLIDCGKPARLLKEKRHAMAEAFLRNAWALPARSGAVRENMIRALGENPAVSATPLFLGLLRRMIFSRA